MNWCGVWKRCPLIRQLTQKLYTSHKIYESGDTLVYSFNDTTGYGFHGDFFNGWKAGIMDGLINGCGDDYLVKYMLFYFRVFGLLRYSLYLLHPIHRTADWTRAILLVGGQGATATGKGRRMTATTPEFRRNFLRTCKTIATTAKQN